jgi:hypothetical protein
MLNNSPEFALTKGNISISSDKTLMSINGIEYDHLNHRFSLDSFSVKPVLDRDSFMKTKVWETDYMEFKTGKTVISGIDHELFFTDSGLVRQENRIILTPTHRLQRQKAAL